MDLSDPVLEIVKDRLNQIDVLLPEAKAHAALGDLRTMTQRLLSIDKEIKNLISILPVRELC